MMKLNKIKNLNKYILNTNWLAFEHIIRLCFSLFVGVWIARYLGPENFGLLSFSLSIISIFSIVSSFGIDNVLVKRLVLNKQDDNKLLGSAFCIKSIFSFLSIFGIVAFVFISPTDKSYEILLLIMSISIVFKSFSVIELDFQSRVKSKYSVKANLITIVFTSLLKVYLILYEASLVAFAWVTFFEALILSISYVFFYIQNGKSLKHWFVRRETVLSILKESWPLVLSSLVVILYMRLDLIMIQNMLGSFDAGIYASAIRLSEAWYFIPTVITTSLFPAILNAKVQGGAAYINKMSNLYKLLIYIGVAFALIITFSSDLIILLIFGNDYLLASNVLTIHIWMGVFVAIQLISSKWLLAENMSKFIFYRGILGLIINIVLNYVLIPIIGIEGAAYASLITMFVSVILFDFSTKKTREHLKVKLSGLYPFFKPM